MLAWSCGRCWSCRHERGNPLVTGNSQAGVGGSLEIVFEAAEGRCSVPAEQGASAGVHSPGSAGASISPSVKWVHWST